MQVVSSALACAPQPRPRKSPRNQLGDLAQRIHAEHRAVLAAVKLGAEHAMAAGDLLLKAKPRFGHGQWVDWVECNCKITKRSAQVYMQLARNRSTIEAKAQSSALSDLSTSAALKLIAAPPKAKNGASPPPKPAQPMNGFESQKRSTRFDLMAVWLSTPAEDRLHFMADVGLMWRRDAEADELLPPAPPVAGYAIPDDLSIPECLRVTA